jgi:hypothetical protein
MNLEKPVINPYAPPRSALDAALASGCSRDGKLVVVPTGAALPARCVKCNAPALLDRPRAFSWHHPGWYLLIVLAVLVYIIVGLIVRKKVWLAIGLCEHHRSQRRMLNLTAVGMFLLGAAALYCAFAFDLTPLGWAGLVALVVALVAALWATSTLSVARIDEQEARFRGCSAAFLDSLP